MNFPAIYQREEVIHLNNGLIFYLYRSDTAKSSLYCLAASLDEARLRCAEMILQINDC